VKGGGGGEDDSKDGKKDYFDKEFTYLIKHYH